MGTFCHFDRWMYSRSRAALLMLVAGLVLVAVGVWLLTLVPWFGGEAYGNGESALAYHAAYGQAGACLVIGSGITAVGLVALGQRRKAGLDIWKQRPDGAATSWPTARRPLRRVALALTALAGLVVLLGVVVTIADPSAADYWVFGLPMGGLLAAVSWGTYRLTRPAVVPDVATWQPGQ